MSITTNALEINIRVIFSYLFDVFVWLMNTLNGILLSETAKGAIQTVVGVILLAILARWGWAAVFEAGVKYPANNAPDPYNGMHPADVAFHLERGTLPDALGIWTAAILSQQDATRNRDIYINPVQYPIGADHTTWLNFVWMFRHHPDKVTNPGEIPASDYDRQRQNALYNRGEDDEL